MKGVRIALAHEYDGPGGAEMMVLQLAEELRRREYEVVPVLPVPRLGWLGDEFRRRGFMEPETYSVRRALDPKGLFEIIDIFRRQRVDIVHSHEFTMAVYGAAACRRLGIPHVVTMHGNERVLDVWRRRAALRWAFARSRSVIAVSESTKEHLVEGIPVPEESVVAIPNGIFFTPGDRNKVRSELGLTAEDVLVAATGNVIPRKGHIFLLRALAIVHDRMPDVPWHVAIVGGPQVDEGVTMRSLEDFAREAGLEHRIHLLGHRQDVADILAATDIFSMPSLWEGLPVAMLEAMFCEIPVVASAVSGIPQAVTDGEDGFLVPAQDPEALADALIPLLTDGALRARVGLAGKERAQRQYSVAAMVDEYERCYGLT